MSEKRNKPDISNAEYDVLATLCVRLNERKAWHDKTVKTLLGRLVKKDVLSFEKQQRQYLYTPLIARQTYRESETETFVSRLFKGKVAPLVAGFANQKNLSKQDVDELKALIAKWEKDND